MSFLGSALGSVVGGVSSLIGGALSNSANRHAASQQHDWNVSDYRNRYQWTVQDMEKAGLNPILASTQGIGGSINGASALASQYNLGEGVTQGMAGQASSSSAKAAQKQADTAEKIGAGTVEKLHSDVALNGASAKKLEADTASTNNANRLFNDTYDTQLAITRQNLENARKQGDFIDSQNAAKLYEMNVVLPSLAGMYVAQGNAANSSAAYNNQMTAFAGENTAKQRMQNEMRSKYGSDTSDGLVGSVTGATTKFLGKLNKLYFGR